MQHLPVPAGQVVIPAGCRLAIVLPGLDGLGGAERQALLLARLAREAGANVAVWGPGPAGSVAQRCAELGIAIEQVDLRLRVRRLRLWLNLRSFAGRLRRWGAQWVAPYTTGPNVFAALAWRRAGVRACIWNQRDEGQRLGIRPVDFKAVRQVPVLVSNSSHAAQMLVERMHVEASRVRVVHNGVDLPPPTRPAAEWRADLQVAAEAPVAVMLANLTPRKDHETLLRAWPRVLQRAPHSVLVLAGAPGESAAACRELAAGLGVAGQVRFPGAVSDVSGLLGAATLGVFSSRLEGCPNGVLECMAAGLAVAGTDIPGLREALGEEAAPFLAPAGDSGALADRIVALLADPELRVREGGRNRARIAQEFSPARMAQGTLAALAEAEQAGRP